MSTPPLFKWRHFQSDIILLNVRWYCRYALSYRDLEEMMRERGIEVDHATINRWVVKYAPELDKRITYGLGIDPIAERRIVLKAGSEQIVIQAGGFVVTPITGLTFIG